MTNSIVASEKLAAQSFNPNLAGSNEPALFNPAQVNLDRGMLIAGSMGSGKSNAILKLMTLASISGKSYVHRSSYRDTAIHSFYREGKDFLFSLSDSRGAGYSIFNDVHSVSDVMRLVAALLPQTSRDADIQYCLLRGRELATEAAVKVLQGEDRSNAAFYSILKNETGTAADSDVIAYTVDRLKWLAYLSDGSVSLKTMLAREDSRVFLASHADIAAVEFGLHEFILGRVNQIVPTLENKPVVLIDEFGSLPYKPAELAEVLSQQSVPMVIAIQRVDQLRRKLGNKDLDEVLQKVGAKLVFRTQAQEVLECLGSELDIQDFPDNQGVLSLKGEPARIVKNNPKVYATD